MSAGKATQAATEYVYQIMGENAESVRWWTRSGIYDAYYDKSGRVNIIGMKGERSSDIIGSDKVAVRPAMWVDLSKIG